jgi:hypothetical protein
MRGYLFVEGRSGCHCSPQRQSVLIVRLTGRLATEWKAEAERCTSYGDNPARSDPSSSTLQAIDERAPNKTTQGFPLPRASPVYPFSPSSRKGSRIVTAPTDSIALTITLHFVGGQHLYSTTE